MLDKRERGFLKPSGIDPAEPLWKRVPARDEQGRPLSDFRMLIVGLKSRPRSEIEERIAMIQSVLVRYQNHIAFADLNLRINLLWVSVHPHSRKDMDIAAEIHHLIPEAKLMADYSG